KGEVAGSIPASPTSAPHRSGQPPGDLMHGLRRASLAVVLAGVAGVVLRLRGTEGRPTNSGHWRELSGDEMR
ncbi:MAG TPA: hypothetical protein DEG43_07285, partial [Acidimicrobiaceae bacterium]|nr:hypothetical protein [Acidimicrobiaceae bacterium]